MDPDTAIGGPSAQFPSTRVSLLEATASGLTSEAMNQVIALYWKQPHYLEIMLPGFIVGAIVGFLTQKMGTPAMARN